MFSVVVLSCVELHCVWVCVCVVYVHVLCVRMYLQKHSWLRRGDLRGADLDELLNVKLPII